MHQLLIRLDYYWFVKRQGAQKTRKAYKGAPLVQVQTHKTISYSTTDKQQITKMRTVIHKLTH